MVISPSGTTVPRPGSSAAFPLRATRQLTIANADPRRLNIVATYALADALTWTMPALVSRQLIVKHGDELSRWEVPAT